MHVHVRFSVEPAKSYLNVITEHKKREQDSNVEYGAGTKGSRQDRDGLYT